MKIFIIIYKEFELTGLNAMDNSADGFNVIRYNVGGFYDIHHDTCINESSSTSSRIATWINYLSDVEAGGATVLPRLNISVFPKKHSAIFWHNLLSSGELDHDLIHTGCPVLYGEKYIATRWIRSRGQDHLKCSINQKEHIFLV